MIRMTAIIQSRLKPIIRNFRELDYNEIFRTVGVCSLTDDPLNFLMWSYYNGHAGICVGIDMELVIGKAGGLSRNCPEIRPAEKSALPKRAAEDRPLCDNAEKLPEVQNDVAHLEQAQNAIDGFLSTKSVVVGA